MVPTMRTISAKRMRAVMMACAVATLVAIPFVALTAGA